MRDGLLLIDKTTGCTSHDVVQQARRLVGQRKMGHCGTLDPGATGLLVLTVGKATRLTRFLINAPKIYSGVIRFGAATDTYDASGQITQEASTEGLTLDAVETAIGTLTGTFQQTVPAYSAKKVQGVKYYELARRGQEVPEAKKEITVYDFHVLGELDNDELSFELSCTSGTYVRSLAHDLGREVGCGAHLSALRRLKVGPFQVEDAKTLEQLREADDLEQALEGPAVAFDEIPLPFSDLTTDAVQERRIRHGQTVLIRQLKSEEGDWIKLMNQQRRLIAIGTVIERIGDRGVGVIQPRIVFR